MNARSLVASDEMDQVVEVGRLAMKEPKTLWITVLAWLCCSLMWWLVTQVAGWWVIIPAVLLISLSFTLAIARDLRDLDS